MKEARYTYDKVYCPTCKTEMEIDARTEAYATDLKHRTIEWKWKCPTDNNKYTQRREYDELGLVTSDKLIPI